MDFFSGSGTLAEAVMRENAKDSGKRKYIAVQLQEDITKALTGTSSNAQRIAANAISTLDELGKSYYITELAKERIRRAGEKIKCDTPLTTANLDVGFRVFKLDDSNMKDVYYSADEYNQQNLVDMEFNINEDRNALDLFFGCLLDWGLPLSMPYHSEKIDGCTIHIYNDGDLIACFDQDIPESVVREIAKRRPQRAVFRDAGFANSPAKINVFEIFKFYMPEDAGDISKRIRVI